MLRAALIGCGRIGSSFADDPLIKGIYTHAAAYTACGATTLVAVCDTYRDAAERCASRWSVPGVYTELDTMLAEARPDLVSVCTPDVTHSAVLDRVLQAPSVKGILAEKPLTVELAEAERIARRAQERAVALAVNYTRRYSEGHQQIRHAIQTGEIGRIQTVAGYYSKGILHNGTHWFDLARWLIGEVSAVHGFQAVGRGQSDRSLDVYLQFECGGRGALFACDEEAFSVFEMDIVGVAGRIRLIDSGHRVQRFDVQDSPRYSGYRSLIRVEDHEIDMADTLLHAVEDLVSCVQSGSPPRCSGADAVAALRLGALAIQSADQRSAVVLAAF